MIEDSLALVGTTIAEKYDVLKVVGEGGFAVVYRAEHRLWKRPVALKVFKALADLPADAREELTQNFIREGALLAELSEKSASICQARDVGVLKTGAGASVPYMVLEWLEGESLEDANQREQAAHLAPRSLLETVRFLEPVADALALAHERGIAHRDVKPANIFLLGGSRDERCPVKLLDFGIAKVVQDIQKSGGAFTKTSGTLTSFTPAYAAPEQFSRSHGPTGPWTDVFSLALVAVELITGREPLDGDSFMQLGFASSDKSVRPTPRARGVATTDAVEAVFLRALAVDRTERYPSAAPFWRDLRQAVGFDLAAASESGPFVARPSRVSVDVVGKTEFVDVVPSRATSTATAISPSSAPAPVRSKAVGLAVACAVLGAGLAFVGYRYASGPAAPGPGGQGGGGGGGGGGGSLAAPVGSVPPVPAVASAAPSSSGAMLGDGGTCPEGMAFIPGGNFFMGSDDGLPGERPEHKVKLAPYCMDVFEVTTARYIACSDVGWCKRASTTNVEEGTTPPDAKAYDRLCNERDPSGKAQHPINCVTWEMADVFCRTNHRRLPTEAEWEFAARGSDGRAYPWGDAPPSAHHLNACGTECAAWGVREHVAPIVPMYAEDDHWPNTAPVGSFAEGKSKFGVMDLAGNVWEWVSDWYGPYAKGDGVSSLVAPTGPTKGTRKVIRGGAWNGSQASWERPSFRYSKEPSDRSHGIGFRCAVDPG